MSIGAIRGAALSRRYLFALTAPFNAFFGSRRHLTSQYSRGFVPLIGGMPYAASVAASMQFKEGTGHLAEVVLNQLPVAIRLRPVMERQSACAVGALFGEATSFFMIPILFATAACEWSCHWASANIKLAATAPIAAAGAMAGAAVHIITKARVHSEPRAWPRGARKEETFGLFEDVTQIPSAYFFLSEDRFGIDLRELSKFVRVSGRLINPHTNTQFSARDLETLISHPSGWFDNERQMRVFQKLFLTEELWRKYLDHFIDFATEIAVNGHPTEASRINGCNKIATMIDSSEPFEALAIKLFFQELSGLNWDTMTNTICRDKTEAQDIAASLLRVCSNLGGAALGAAIISRLEQTRPVGLTSSIMAFAEEIKASSKQLEPTYRLCIEAQHPWISKAMLPKKKV